MIVDQFKSGFRRADPDAKPHWKPKSSTYLRKLVVTGMQDDAVQFHDPTKVYLHPLFGVSSLSDRAVVAKFRWLGSGTCKHLQAFDVRLGFPECAPIGGSQLSVQISSICFQQPQCIGKFFSPLGCACVGVVRSFSTIHRSVHRLQAVVVLLRNRVKLMIVAASTLYCRAAKGIHRCRHHLVSVKVPSFFAIEL